MRLTIAHTMLNYHKLSSTSSLPFAWITVQLALAKRYSILSLYTVNIYRYKTIEPNGNTGVIPLASIVLYLRIDIYSVSLVLAVNEQYQSSICWLSPLVLPATFVLHSFSVFHPTKCGRDLIKISQVGGHLTSLRSGKWLFVAGMAISLFNFQCGTNLVAGHFLPGLSWAFFQSTLDTEGAKIQIYSEILRT